MFPSCAVHRTLNAPGRHVPDPQQAQVGPGHEVLAVGREGQGEDPSRGTFEGPDFAPVVGPQIFTYPIPAGGGEHRRLGRVAHRLDPTGAHQDGPLPLAGLHVPQDRRVVRGTGQEGLGIGREVERVDVVGMAGHRRLDLPRGEVPDLRRAVLAARHQGPAVAGELETLHAPGVGEEPAQDLARRGVPDPDHPIVLGGRQGLAVRCEGDPSDPVGLLGPVRRDRLPRFEMIPPEFAGAPALVPRARNEPFAIGRECDAPGGRPCGPSGSIAARSSRPRPSTRPGGRGASATRSSARPPPASGPPRRRSGGRRGASARACRRDRAAMAATPRRGRRPGAVARPGPVRGPSHTDAVGPSPAPSS